MLFSRPIISNTSRNKFQILECFAASNSQDLAALSKGRLTCLRAHTESRSKNGTTTLVTNSVSRFFKYEMFVGFSVGHDSKPPYAQNPEEKVEITSTTHSICEGLNVSDLSWQYILNGFGNAIRLKAIENWIDFACEYLFVRQLQVAETDESANNYLSTYIPMLSCSRLRA